ncbi:hypothetical protein [Cupriavidus sp. TMH.W2]|uniref:hypothetical protein n=1 Tax=Cupriavidus sp. TMH.W2 TaxID=3434465 RepID=UPI003D788534
MVDMYGFEVGMEVVGTLRELHVYASVSKADVSGLGTGPMLTCMLAASKAHCVPEGNVASCVHFEPVQLRVGVLMAVRVQLGSTQIIWLADMTDPEIWQAIERWKREKAMPIVVGVKNGDGWNYHTYLVPMPTYELSIEGDLPKMPRWEVEALWMGMTSPATRYIVQARAQSDKTLEHVFVYPLLTAKMSELRAEPDD